MLCESPAETRTKHHICDHLINDAINLFFCCLNIHYNIVYGIVGSSGGGGVSTIDISITSEVSVVFLGTGFYLFLGCYLGPLPLF